MGVPILQGEEPSDVYERLSLTYEVAEIAPECTYHETAAPTDPAFVDRLSDLTTGIVTRIAGSDRYATTAVASQDTFPPTSGMPFVVTGETYPDGMSASPIAFELGAPVPLTEAHHLPTATRTGIVRLSPKLVIIVGGTNGVSSAVERSSRGLGFDVERIPGSDRYDTAAALSAPFVDPTPRSVLLATGEAFPDALSGAAAGPTSEVHSF